MNLPDRMKMYESQTTKQSLMPGLPILVRLDGKNFSTFTRGLKRPFDDRLSKLMIETTKYLVKETNANAGYTGSDEITLVFYNDKPDSDLIYGGKLYKMQTDLAAMCSVYFYSKLEEYLPEKAGNIIRFDARAWNTPSLIEATNSFLDREWSTTKNSISMAAEVLYSPEELKKKNGSMKQEMLFQKGINWNEYPTCFKRGVYIQKKVKLGKIDKEDIEKLPLKHNARLNPDLGFKRSIIVELDLPPLAQVKNKVDVLIFGKEVE